MANSKSCQTAETIETQWNQHWKFTDGETVAGQASQGFVENYCSSGMIFKVGKYSGRHGSQRGKSCVGSVKERRSAKIGSGGT